MRSTRSATWQLLAGVNDWLAFMIPFGLVRSNASIGNHGGAADKRKALELRTLGAYTLVF
jgi:hypothetical protein